MKVKTLSKDLASHMIKGVGMNMKTSTRKRGMIEIPRGTTLRSMRIRREPEVLQEGKDPAEKIETIKEETTIEETTALIEGNMPLKEGAGGNIALIEEGREARETILLI